MGTIDENRAFLPKRKSKYAKKIHGNMSYFVMISCFVCCYFYFTIPLYPETKLNSIDLCFDPIYESLPSVTKYIPSFDKIIPAKPLQSYFGDKELKKFFTCSSCHEYGVGSTFHGWVKPFFLCNDE